MQIRHFVNFDASPRNRGWGEGQTGDTIKLTKDHSLNTSNNIVGLFLNFRHLWSNLNEKMLFFNFGAAPRSRGWGEGQTGDSTELTKNHILNTSNNIMGLLLCFEHFWGHFSEKMPFFNFDAAPRPRGWGEGQTGDTVEFTKDSSVDINNKNIGLSLIVFEQFSFKGTWGQTGSDFWPRSPGHGGRSQLKMLGSTSGPGPDLHACLVEFGLAVCLETLTEQNKKKNKQTA